MATNRKWSQDQMVQAYQDCKFGGLSVYAAAKKYNVPRMTLSDRVLGKVKLQADQGHPTALSKSEEEALEKYIHYMQERRFPITREQVMSIAWAIDLKKEQITRAFGETGPSLTWWCGFRNRHPDLTLKAAESVDKGYVENATSENINHYFDLLEEVLEKNDLKDKPHLIYNCDESAIILNKAAKKVIVPRRCKRAHTISTTNSQHVSVLCACNAAGTAIPPLIVFSKGLPAGRFHKDGPVNASYSTTQSGFVDREVYTSWFLTTFLKFAPAERPLLLLQDGASAHMGPDLIDAAISNDVIILCFPAKTTHILQPCDVGIYRSMKANLRRTMQQLKMLRGTLGIQKCKVPAIIKGAFENAFAPALITNAFRTCGIYPFNRDAILSENPLIAEKQSAATGDVATKDQYNQTNSDDVDRSMDPGDASDMVLSDITVDVVTPSQVPPDAKVVLEGTEPSGQQICPPSLALEAIERTLTPKKKHRYLDYDSRGVISTKDPVYTTWRYLHHQVVGIGELPAPAVQQHPLVTAGVIPRRLVDVFYVPPEREKTIRLSRKAAVLTSEEIINEYQEREGKEKQILLKKQEKQATRRQKQPRKRSKNNNKSQKSKMPKKEIKNRNKGEAQHTVVVQNPTDWTSERSRYFAHLQIMLMSCSNFAGMESMCPSEEKIPLTFTPPSLVATKSGSTHKTSENLISSSYTPLALRSVAVGADGNCLPRTISFLCVGDESIHVEMRVRIVMELIAYKDLYLSDDFLSMGHTATGRPRKVSARYSTYSPAFQPESALTSQEISRIYEVEVMDVIKPGAYCGVWQIHAAASVLQVPIRSLYPGNGPPKQDLDTLLKPRYQRSDRPAYVLWSHTTNSDLKTWWQPNHFVPCLQLTATPSQEDVDCVVCGENYANSKRNEVWVECQRCQGWAHEECTPMEGVEYLCDHCIK